MNATLDIGQIVDGYRIVSFMKRVAYSGVESYIVINEKGKKGLMKLFPTEGGDYYPEYDAFEAHVPNFPFLPVMAKGEIVLNGLEYRYMVREYASAARRLSDLLAEGKRYSWDEAQPIIHQIMVALKSLHSLEPAVIHNDLSPRNILLIDMNGRTRVYVIGTGCLSNRISDEAVFDAKGLDNWYRAPETFDGVYTEKTDIFSAGALLYAMLKGVPPWGEGFDGFDPNIDKHELGLLRSEGKAAFADLNVGEVRREILYKMLAEDCDNRFKSADDVLKAFRWCYLSVESTLEICEQMIDETIEKVSGGGFAEVAGMEDVKQILRDDVLFVIKNQEKANKYRLKQPNGILFYGPPGCGKTYIAEKFAEESKLNFIMVKGSDVGSIYIHGTQGKIAEIFKDAAENAPTVLCFDELDGMIPDRENIKNDSASSEVNEFLSQMNNCSERGIFVIGTTNRPDKIDPAALRTGRMDRIVYIPMPDKEARKELFRIHLDGRYCDGSINLEELAERTEGYVSSDIAFIANQGALKAAIADIPISQDVVLEQIGKFRRSITKEAMAAYERQKANFEQIATVQGRRRIGF